MNLREQKSLIWKTIILCGLSLLIFIFGLFPNMVLSIYSKGIYPVISSILRRISSILLFAVGDMIYLLIITVVVVKVMLYLRKLKAKGIKNDARLTIPLGLLQLILILYISFKLLWGLNYARPSISEQLHIDDQKYSVKELVLLGDFFVHKLNELQPQINFDRTYSISQLREQSIAAYAIMEDKNPFFSYEQPSIKPVLNNWAVSKIGIEGYYNPVSGEANINMALPPWVLPFVSCHEISHQLGVAREDEANLVAYLVGMNSSDTNLKYSVHYNMLRYILFEIKFKSPDDYLTLRNQLLPEILAQFKAENEFWNKYNGHMSNYMGMAFDKFLKLNNQKRGIKSYQNIVVWLWNLHKKELVKK